jgi:hypothetical protein
MQAEGSVPNINPTSLLRRLLTNRKAKIEGWLIAFQGDEICLTDPNGVNETYFASTVAGCANALKAIQSKSALMQTH